jgi:hypothetical protein
MCVSPQGYQCGSDDDHSASPAECLSSFPFLAMDSAQRLLLREGVIDEIPPDLCGNAKNASKNVILVVGDGMGVSFSCKQKASSRIKARE